jgi:hypothetical protein
LICKNLESWIVPQAIGIVDVFITGDDLIDPLTKQRQRGMTDPFFFTGVTQSFR